MKYIAIIFMFIGLVFGVLGGVQNAPAALSVGGGFLIFGLLLGILYLFALFETAMQATIKSSEELGQIRAKLAAIDAKIPRPETRPSPAPTLVAAPPVVVRSPLPRKM